MIQNLSTSSYIEQWVGAEASAHVMKKLERYVDLLLKTNDQYNLIGPKEADQIWQRHILDSAQLYPIIQSLKPSCIMDIGAGAGFPAIVLSIMGISNIILVESIQKKARFLQEVIEALELPAEVCAMRMENLEGPKPDLITGRAVSALDNLLEWSYHLCRPSTKFLFLKGEKVQEEIMAAQKRWKFECALTASLTSPTGQILQLQNLKKR